MDHLLVRMAVEHEIGVGLGETDRAEVLLGWISARQQHPRRRMHQPAAACRRASISRDAAAPASHSIQHRSAPQPLARAHALGAEEAFFVIAEDRVRAAFPKDRRQLRWKTGIPRCCHRGKSARRHRPSGAARAKVRRYCNECRKQFKLLNYLPLYTRALACASIRPWRTLIPIAARLADRSGVRRRSLPGVDRIPHKFEPRVPFGAEFQLR